MNRITVIIRIVAPCLLDHQNLDTNVILFSMWTEAVKNFAEYGKGNIIFLDGSADGMERTMKQIEALMIKKDRDISGYYDQGQKS